jgi:acyl-CoA reductase-like NAD-dependent aldehyde dehydrogenase
MSVLQDFKRLSGHVLIAGELVRAGGALTLDVIDPATEQVLGQITEPSEAQVEAAVAAAEVAQAEWWGLSSAERADALHQVAARLTEMAPVVGEAMSREMGKPYREGQWEPGAAANAFRYYAELAKHDAGRLAGPAIAGQIHMVMKEPLGTVVSIVPFNYPILLMSWQAAAALAAGNAVIVKPSDLTALTTLIAARAFDHLPKGLFQVLTGSGKVGATLVGHAKTHGVAFTGSVANAQSVARRCGELFKPVLIEASGNDPFIVMPSANPKDAARGAAFAAFLNCGQVCTSAERFYVHEAIHDEFVAELAAIARNLRIGRGLDLVDLGPMAARRERDRFELLLATTRAEGAKVVTGGGRPAGLNRGFFVEPTVLTDVHQSMKIMQDESFGPSAPICRVKSLDEALEHANNSRMGLGANILTADLSEAMRAVREIQSGIVWVNTPLNDNDAIPFGGRKLSGIGRELGTEGLDQFRQSKMAIIAPKLEPDPEWFPYPDDMAFDGAKD